MAAPAFHYQDPFPLAKDDTRYRLLTKEGVTVAQFDGKEILKVDASALVRVAREAMRECSFFLRASHNDQVAKILQGGGTGNGTSGARVAWS